MGMERLISVIPFENVEGIDIRPDIFVVGLGTRAQKISFEILHELRANGLSADMDFEGGSMKS